MAKQPMIERSENYGYYSDLWCAVPLTGMAWYYTACAWAADADSPGDGLSV